MVKTYNKINLGFRDLNIFKRIHHYKKIKSTQQLALFLAETNIKNEHGTVIIADEQSEGIGRGKKKWVSPMGGLWMSLIIQPRIEIDKINMLSVISAISVCETINEILHLKTYIKWPNDILINDKKLAGILINTSINNNKIDYIVIGIGINIKVDIEKIKLFIDPNNILPSEVTSLQQEIEGKRIDRLILMKHLLRKIEFYLSLLEHDKFHKKIIEIYKNLLNTLGKRITVYQEGLKKYSGLVLDIDNTGGLILERDDRLREIIYSGEITIRKEIDK
ncbi:MAG TPA: biotin--[acetyl-CoA-carboxylase] ligase [Nitrososphaeraceae archaeon]|nr:biotin--[acetyl-CoA-carboxylase] ligase [Nitrososphaeraceae archaeon]